MNNSKNDLLTTNELIFTLIGCIIGAGILSLPNSVVAQAKQDGWISTAVGGIYPLYVVLVGGIIIKRFPDKTIMDVSTLYLGQLLGNFLNFLFMAQFLLYVVGVIGAANSILRVYAVWFMTPFKISLVLVILVIYACSKDLKTIAKINVLMFFILVLIILSLAMALKYGTLLNVQPIFGAGLSKIFKASIESAFAYGNMEILFVLHPFVKNKNTIIRAALIATGIITVIYTWTVFTTIFYLGPDIVPKSLWPFFYVSESIKIPAITSFRFIYMALWTLLIFKTATSQYYASTAIFNTLFKKINKKYICFLLSPLIFLLPLLFQNEVARRDFFTKVMPWVTLFNLFYITLISILIAITKKKVPKSNPQKG
jgi:spore germination protein (amino acid permease)